MTEKNFNTTQFLNMWDFTAILFITLTFATALITHLVNSVFLCDNEGDKPLTNKIVFGLSTGGMILFVIYYIYVLSKKAGGYSIQEQGYKPFVLAMTTSIFILVVSNFVITLLSTPEVVVIDKNMTQKDICLYKAVGMVLNIFIVCLLNYYGGFGFKTFPH